MLKRIYTFSVVWVVALTILTGCATTKPRRPDAQTESQNQISQLQAKLEEKDQQIQELEARVETYEQALQSVSTAGTRGAASSSIIRVRDVSVEDVQRALIHAGFDPGPVDGRAGKKTKAAIREFQRRNNLKADGIVGERTWTRLK